MTVQQTDGDLSLQALAELREAKEILEHHGIADRLTEMMGAPVTASLKILPSVAEKAVYDTIEKSLTIALDVALRTLGQDSMKSAKPRLLTHKLLAGITGAAGGALGGATIAAELPVSTVLILRSVADIARSEGEDLTSVEGRLACLEVFALDPGKQTKIDDDTEIGYFAVRAAMAKQIRDASQYVLKNGVSDTSAPALVKLVAKIGERFGLVVSEKIAAQAIPVIGAIGGALINSYFIDHYQDLARAHFAIRRLERSHGEVMVRESYRRITL
ncbi:EcsC protein family protein [Rubripirellula lacrimiformis]|uniref:EcsC protein family protein n=1 Tax=Rubripirellula lacrimiformis TaxID=1930273 RepID=A0A517NK83_9BACT|nr:EcsC family protein [Rubripirellula lacrimiformis]QDT07555.1 EcsC protein family protein [Rubripirellula lacrimiformis]